MRIYIAGTFTAQERLAVEAEELKAAGHKVTSTWLHEPPKPAGMHHEVWMRDTAAKDLVEIEESDTLILDLFGESTTGGRYVEWGAAYAYGAYLYTVGPVPHMACFMRLADRNFADWTEAHAFFKGAR